MGSVGRKRRGTPTESDDTSLEELSSDEGTSGDVEMGESSSGTASGDAEGESTPSVEQLEASFEFFDPSEKDFPSLNELLRQQFGDIPELQISELTETIIQQVTLRECSHWRTSDDDDCFVLGVISVLNFTLYKDLSCVQQLKAFVLDRCSDASMKHVFAEAMASPKAGLLVCERLMNVPPEIGPPLNQSLFEEMEWAQEDEPTEERREAFKMNAYVMMTHVYQDPTEEAPNGHQTKRSKVKGPSGYIYVKPEDEFYHKFSQEWFTVPIDEQLRELRLMRLWEILRSKPGDVTLASTAVAHEHCKMEASVLKDKLRKLQATQETINATADYLIENCSDAKRIVKAWNEEFTSSNVNRKLTLLYLANDVLQRCKSTAFLPGFLHYLPKATAHLFKHGDAKIRAAVMRLVEVWSERKVLRSQGIAAVRSQLEKVKDTPAVEEEKGENGTPHGNKRKRAVAHPIQESLDEVEEATKRRTELEKAMNLLTENRELKLLSKEELMQLTAFSEQHCVLVKSEVQVRKKVVELLKETLTPQEEGLQNSKEKLRLCFVRQEEIKKASAPAENIAAEEPFIERNSLSLSEEKNETSLMAVDASPSTLLSEQNAHGYQTASLAYQPTLLPHYPPVGPIAYASHPPAQPVHAVAFSMMHRDSSADKAQEHDMTTLYRQAPPFMGQPYMPDAQGHPPLAPYETRMIHDLHSPFGPQLNYGGYHGQYESEKDWRT